MYFFKIQHHYPKLSYGRQVFHSILVPSQTNMKDFIDFHVVQTKKKSFTYWICCCTCYTIRVIDLRTRRVAFVKTRFFSEVKLFKQSCVHAICVHTSSVNTFRYFVRRCPIHTRNFRFLNAPNSASLFCCGEHYSQCVKFICRISFSMFLGCW